MFCQFMLYYNLLKILEKNMTNIPQFKKKKIYKKWWFWLLIIIILLIGGCSSAGYYSFTKSTKNLSATQQETAVTNKDLQKTVILDGTIKSKKAVNLYFGAEGKVTETQVKIGDLVAADQLLAKIDNSSGYASTKQREIKAPFSGIITGVNIFDGLVVSAQTIAITLESEETQITANASESEVLDLKKDQAVSVTFKTLPDIKLTGTITVIGEKKDALINKSSSQTATASTSSGYEIVADYSKPSDLQLKRDMSCEIKIVVAEKKDVLAIPLAAIKWQDNQPYVNTPSTDPLKPTKKNVKIGFKGDEFVEITEGLTEGEKIILFSSSASSTNGMMF